MADLRDEEFENEEAPVKDEDFRDEPVGEVDEEVAAAEPGGEEDAAGEPAPEPTAEERLQAERDEFESKWLRVVAELDNVRKRSRRELADTRRFSQADVLRKFLDVMDNFDRALQSTPDDDDTGDGTGFREGVELIYQNFRGAMKDLGVTPIEAVGQLPRDGVEHGIVIEVVAEGFMFGDMVLRPARVIISS